MEVYDPVYDRLMAESGLEPHETYITTPIPRAVIVAISRPEGCARFEFWRNAWIANSLSQY